MTQQALLIELGCEELPAAQVHALAQTLAQGLRNTLIDHALVAETQAFEVFATPRRLAFLIGGVAATQDTQRIERKGPALSAAFDDAGQPTKAALGFAASVGKSVDALERITTDQGEWLGATIKQPGKTLEEILQANIAGIIEGMASARSMRWRQGDERFVRPIRWWVVLHGDRALPVELFGLTASHQTFGHRVHAAQALVIKEARAYEATLLDGYVVAHETTRKAQIQQQVSALLDTHHLTLDETSLEALLEENTQLTEWPQALIGSFDESFLVVPEPALISAMVSHQKCFALRDRDGKLSPHFIVVANIESEDVEAMRAGFERVIRPRLSDAQFFWDQDKLTLLSTRRSRLDSVLFQKDLGSLGQKTDRLQALCAQLAPVLGVDVTSAQQAAGLAKCDLVTDMVAEFPELQGVMGYHYALNEGIDEKVAIALSEHYLPKNPSDALPNTPLGALLAIADRADTLVGIFGAGLRPKGNKDPFALRRAALGLIRLLESREQLSLVEVLESATQPLSEQLGWSSATQAALVADVLEFCMERARSYALDQNIQTLTFNAVVAVEPHSVADLMARAHAVERLLMHPDIDALIAANKRLANLLGQQEADLPTRVETQYFSEPEEHALFDLWVAEQGAIAQDIEQQNYDSALKALASLAQPLDRYFEKVMVMTDDLTVRHNRLALLSQMRCAFLSIADLAKLGR